MSDTLQFAQHPDPDQLTAFAEQALPLHEREQTLAHLAVCADCRQIVFLAQQAAEPEPVSAPKATPAKAWFSGWHLAWAGAAALAGIVGLTVYLRTLPTAAPAPQAIATAAPAPVVAPVVAPSVAPAQPASKPAPLAKPAVVGALTLAQPKVSAAPAKIPAAIPPPKPIFLSNGALDRLDSESRNLTALARTREATASPGVLPQPAAIHGGMVGMAAASPAPVKVAPAPPQVALGRTTAQTAPNPVPPTNLVALDQVQMAANIPPPPPPPAAPKPVTPGGPSQSQQFTQQAAQTVTVAAAPTITVSGAADISVVDATSATSEIVFGKPLPSKLPTLATAANGAATVAIDRAGSVFFSKDRGAHWKRVAAKWSGKAARIDFNAATKPAAFELTTDGGTVWTSQDGQSWKLR
jgi:hypothetical protein